MKKILLSVFGLAILFLGGCADSNTFDRNTQPSNANAAVQNSTNSNQR